MFVAADAVNIESHAQIQAFAARLPCVDVG